MSLDHPVVYSPIRPGLFAGLLILALALPAFGTCPRYWPDDYGYTTTANDVCPELSPVLEDISASGTVAATVSNEDDAVETVPIGFAFTYYGNTYTNLEISSNGFLSFGDQGTSDRLNGDIPQTNGVNNHIAGWWDDLNPGTAGTIYYETRGSAPNRRFIVHFDEVDRFGGGGITTNTFQFKLFEDSHTIEVHYESLDPDSSATIGIENESGTDGIEAWNFPGPTTLPAAWRFQLDVVTNRFAAAPGGLREVLTNALPGATIRFAPSLDGQTIALPDGELELFEEVTIDASDLPKGITIAGAGTRIFNITATNERVTLRGLTLEDGDAGSGNGGGISMSAAGTELILDNCLIRNCRGRFGGGIYAPNNRTLRMANCTLVDNEATLEGGALFSVGSNSLINVTMTGNRAASRGGAIQHRGHLTLLNTLIAENDAPNEGPDIDVTTGATYTLNGVNLIGDTGGSALSASTNLLVNPDPQLMPLGYYGGPTRTRHPMQGSPAVDPVGSQMSPPVLLDQRGAPRFAGATLDIGAVEVQDVLTVTSVADSGGGSLREAVGLATNLGAVIRFDPIVTVLRIGDELVVGNGQAIVVDAGDASVLLHGEHSDRLFRVEAGGSLALQGFTLTGGSEPANDGGAISNSGVLSLGDCRVVCNRAVDGGGIYTAAGSCLSLARTVVADNRARDDGGGLYANNALVCRLDHSRVMDNSAPDNGGGIYHVESRARLRRCTVSGNRSGDRGGGLFNDSTLNITEETRLEHCTFSENVAGARGGGGLHNQDGKLDADFCTFTDNRADFGDGGGIQTFGDNATRTALNHCIVSGNRETDLDLFSGLVNAYISAGYNLVGSGDDLSSFVAAGDITGTADPNLAPLGWYGGCTPTRPPLTGSPVLNMGTNNPAFAVDQRGYPRRVGGNADIGATESGPVVAIANLDNTGSGSLRDVIATAGLPGTLITLIPGTIELTDELLLLPGRSVLLDGSTADITLEAAGFDHRLVNLSGADSVLGLVGVALEGGTAPVLGSGGAISTIGTLTLVDCTVSGAEAGNSGGGIYGAVGSRTWLARTTLGGNEAASQGGGMCTDGELRTVDCNWVGNRSDFFGGGLLVSEKGRLTMKRCWVADNDAPSGGAGLGLFFTQLNPARSYHLVQASTFVGNADQGKGVITTQFETKLDRCTVTGNRPIDPASSPSAVVVGPALPGLVEGRLDMVSCLVTENPGLMDVAAVTNDLVSLGGNLVGTASANFFTAAGDQTGVTDAMLGPPGYYGGFTKVRHPLAGSPAIDPAGGGSLSFAAGDQRGFAALVGGIDDAGAVEVGPVRLVTSTANAGAGTLRQAVQAAGRGDVIRFDGGTFPATIFSDTQLVIDADQAVFLDASDRTPGAVTVDGQDQDRLFQVEAGATLALHNLVLTNGNSGVAANGGGIHSAGSLTAVDSVIRDSIAEGAGGGIYSEFGARLCLTDSELIANSAFDSGGGGGIWNGGEMRLEGCRLADNECLNPGGGGLRNEALDGALMLNCLVVSNLAFGSGGTGGGLSNGGGLIMETCTVLDNRSQDDRAGGIYNRGDLWMMESTVAGNRMLSSFGRGGGIDNDSGNLVMHGCTVAGNDSAGDGGGIYHQTSSFFGGSAVLTNCTISGNVATNIGGGFLDDSGARLEYCTLTGNAAALGGGVASDGVSGSEKMSFQTCIVSGNTGGDIAALGTNRNYESRGSNLIGTESDPTAFILFDDITGVTDPVLLPLGDYGGPTETHLPHPGSPAIDAVQRFTDAVVDQRAFPRGDDGDFDMTGAPDIGAVELSPSRGDLALLWGTDLDGDGAAFGVEFAIGGDPLVNDTSTNAPGVAMGTLDAGVDMGDPVFTFGFSSNAVPYTAWRITGTSDLVGNNWNFPAFAYDGSMNTTNVHSKFEAALLADSIVLREISTVPNFYYRLEADYVGPVPSP